jgi:hypothetical protein
MYNSGSGSRLQQSVGRIIHNSLSNFANQLANKGISHNQTGVYNPPASTVPSSVEIKNEPNPYAATERRSSQADHSYPPSVPTYGLYAPGVQPPQPAYAPAQPSYAQSNYSLPTPESARLTPSLILPTLNTTPPNPAYGPTNQFFPPQDVAPATPAEEWLRWSQANVSSFVQPGHQPDYMTPANPLVNLSSRPSAIQGSGQASAAAVAAAQAQDAQWPTNLYHLSLPGHSSG